MAEKSSESKHLTPLAFLVFLIELLHKLETKCSQFTFTFVFIRLLDQLSKLVQNKIDFTPPRHPKKVRNAHAAAGAF